MAEKGSVALGDLFVGSKDELYVPFVVGNVSVHLGSEAVEHSKTHEWLVYVRGLENEDLSWIVKKVQFTLHESFEKPVREIIKPPFEVAESGWGEFEVKVKVFFRDNIAKPIEFTHYLALYHLSPEKDPKSPVISETYDEFVFPNPSEVVKQLFERGVKNRTVFADHPHMKLCKPKHSFILI